MIEKICEKMQDYTKIHAAYQNKSGKLSVFVSMSQEGHGVAPLLTSVRNF